MRRRKADNHAWVLRPFWSGVLAFEPPEVARTVDIDIWLASARVFSDGRWCFLHDLPGQSPHFGSRRRR